MEYLNLDLNDVYGRIRPRATEPVTYDDLNVGDTIIFCHYPSTRAYRVVAEVKRNDASEMVFVKFDLARDGIPLSDFSGTFSSDSEWTKATAPVERVTDLGDREMTRLAQLKELDYIISADKLVWQVAKNITSKGELLVRFAHEDSFTPLPMYGVVEVYTHGRRGLKHIREIGEAKRRAPVQ